MSDAERQKLYRLRKLTRELSEAEDEVVESHARVVKLRARLGRLTLGPPIEAFDPEDASACFHD